jgi:small subunit ribosomal protein S13
MTKVYLNFHPKFKKKERNIFGIFSEIYGISRKNVEKIILLNFGFLKNKKAIEKDFDEINSLFLIKVQFILEKYKKKNIQDILRKQQENYDIDILKPSASYKALRKKNYLPCRGQRTKTNAQTCKKKKKKKTNTSYTKKKKSK